MDKIRMSREHVRIFMETITENYISLLFALTNMWLLLDCVHNHPVIDKEYMRGLVD